MTSPQVPAAAREAGRLLDVPALAAWLGLTEGQVRHRVERNQIPVTRVGHRVMFDMVEINKWLKRKTEDAA